jgi:hypothetical protein
MSTNWPNQEKIVYGIVVGGDDKDPDPTESGGVRVYIPGEYGPSVKRTHLPMSRVLTMGTQEGVTKFNPPPERGSAVMCMKMPGQAGTGHLVVLGVVPNDINNDDTVPGNLSLISFLPVINQAILHKVNILIPPNIVEKNKRGAQIRVPVEKGVKHSHSLMKGIPSTGTLYNLLGYPIPQVHNISTAIDAFTAIVTKEVGEMLPGTTIDIANLLEILPGTAITELEEIMPEPIWNAFKATINLMQQMTFVETSGFLTAFRVNEKTYLANAIRLLKDVKNIKDMEIALRRLQFDTSLFGLDEIIETIKIKTPFGEIGLTIIDGVITNLVPKEVADLIKAFLDFLNDPSEFPSVLPDKQPFFGEATKTFVEMLPRLTPKEFEKRKELLEFGVGNKSDPRKRLNDYQKIVTLGGNILELVGGLATAADEQG